METIKIKCKTQDSISLDDLVEFQGNLKARTDEDVDLLIKSIKEYGFSFPFFVWKNEGKNWCLDGHGRILALKKLREGGMELPDFPVAYVSATDEEEAKQKLLRLNSTYGTITRYGLANFIGEIDVNYNDLRLCDTYIDFSKDVFDTAGDLSTNAVLFNILHFKEYKIPMRDEEFERIKAALDAYVSVNGSGDGFFWSMIKKLNPEKQ
jgi:hypothetical protein